MFLYSIKMVQKRSFTVVNMTKSDGCPTKFTGG